MDATFFKLATHNGCVTISNPATGNHRTFRIRTQSKDSTFRPGERIVALLDGPDNTTNYLQFGFVNADGTISLWNRYRNSEVFQQYTKLLMAPEVWSKNHGLRYQVEGRCRVCNRLLTDPESISSGIGPVCGGREAGSPDEPAGDEVWE